MSVIGPATLDEPPTIAEVLNPDGTVYDRCWNWETAQCMAQSGYTVRVVADDGHMTRDEIQRLCDWEAEIRLDCFGE